MKLKAIILFIIVASASVAPLASFALRNHSVVECPSNHGDDVPPVHTHADCSHSIHSFQFNFLTRDHDLELSSEHDTIKHLVFYDEHFSSSFLKSLFKPPRI